MSEESVAQPSSEPAAGDGDVKKAETTRVLSEVLGHMGVKATLEVKDVADGSVSIAMMIDGDSAGMVVGKRNHVVDSLQFLINKIINKTPQSRRYINLGVGEHPAPRQQKQPPAPPAPKEKAAAAPPAQKQKAAPPPAQKQPRQARLQSEATVEVEEDVELTAAARELAEKAAKHGRFVGLLGLTADDRARVAKAVKDVPGVQVKLEGEGRARRLSLHPDKPTAMPKSMLPDYDDEEDDEEQE